MSVGDIIDIHWNKKTSQIGFTDADGTRWHGKGTLRILRQLADGVEVELAATVQGIVNRQRSPVTESKEG